MGVIYSSIIGIRTIQDIKKIIAYSSIIHMNIALIGILSGEYIGVLGGTMVIITHA
jgi:NADH:ubiquinone oxidoreductase subunit 4 (subunit M)